jgi:hypothetical protein
MGRVTVGGLRGTHGIARLRVSSICRERGGIRHVCQSLPRREVGNEEGQMTRSDTFESRAYWPVYRPDDAEVEITARPRRCVAATCLLKKQKRFSVQLLDRVMRQE